MHSFISQQLVIFIIITVFIAVAYDIRSQKIPNWLNLTTAGVALFYHGWSHGIDGIIFSLSGLFLGVALLIGPYLLGGMGAGDTKFLGAIGSALGSKGIFSVFLFSAVIGGFYAVIILLINHFQAKAIIDNILYGIKSLIFSKEWIFKNTVHHEKRPKLRYGLAIGLGAFSYVTLESMGYSLINTQDILGFLF